MKISELLESINEKEIRRICEEYEITNYSINPDGSIDVKGNVNLERRELTKIPLRFNHVKGWFWCGNNLELESLEGSPRIVENFNCNETGIESLIGGPKVVKDYFSCGNNPNLKSLEGSPRIVNSFACDRTGIESLIGGPKVVKNAFSCDNNPELKSLEGLPVKGDGIYSNQCPNLTPWETRYVMFCEGLTDVYFDNELDQIYEEYFEEQNIEVKKTMIPDIMDKLQEMS